MLDAGQTNSKVLNMEAVTFSESGGVRYLHFGSELIQGAMRMRDPDEIYLEYNQQMMAWLLFLETKPGMRVAQLGLGTGALTKFQYRYCPAVKTTVVELNPAVIVSARSMFFTPDDDRRLETLQVDAKLYVRAQNTVEILMLFRLIYTMPSAMVLQQVRLISIRAALISLNHLV